MAEHPERERLAAQLEAISETAASPDGGVTATVNSDGVLTSLRFAEDVTRRSPAELADLVLATYVEAMHAAAGRAAQVLLPAGVGGYVIDRLRWRARFTPQERPAPPSDRTDEGWSGAAVRYQASW